MGGGRSVGSTGAGSWFSWGGRASCRGGRPRRGGSAGVTGVEEKHGFSLSMETMSCLSPSAMVNVLDVLRRTL